MIGTDDPITIPISSDSCDSSHLSTNITGSDDDDSVFNLPPPLSPLPHVLSQPTTHHDHPPTNSMIPDVPVSPDDLSNQ